MIKEITVNELQTLRSQGQQHQLIDVREQYEVEVCNIGGLHLPMASIPNNIHQIAKDRPVIIHCKSGGRSAQVVQYLVGQGFENVMNLKGGIFAWIDQIDPSLPKY